MKVLSSRIFWGMVLIIGGTLLLLDTFGVIEGGYLFWAVITAFAGVLFLSLVLGNRQHWWALIPGVSLLGIGITLALDYFFPAFSDQNLTGAFIIGGFAVSFYFVYIVNMAHWWAIIPAGILTTIAAVVLTASNSSGLAAGGIFFFGLGATFALVALLPTPGGHMRWAWIPAGILGIFGLLILATAEVYINYVWPSALIIAGIFLVGRSFKG